MKINAIIIGTLFMTSSCNALNSRADFSLLHYNIKELDSQKIKNNDLQIQSVKKIIEQYEFDIISLNEIQYDYPNIPDQNYKSEGENLSKLQKLLSLDQFMDQVFYPANTGKNAKTKEDGTYHTNPNSNDARMMADQVNFGTMPGQYSTGALFKYPKVSEKIYTDINWKLFNPNIDLSKFKDALGNSFPEDMSLFDKNFTDVVLNIKGKQVHLILLHTVPSFNFGNEQGPNFERNRDQLKFLEWYLTGKTDFKVTIPGIKPLDKDAYFVAVGDWNIAPTNLDAPSSLVLKRILKNTNSWMKLQDLSFTNESSSFIDNPSRLMLDYITTSKNIKILDGSIIHPDFKRDELGCGDNIKEVKAHSDFEVVQYFNRENLKCHALVGKEYLLFKTASDHFPLFAKFKFK